MTEQEQAFAQICDAVSGCHKCDRMRMSARILSEASGPLYARIMFVGEAPGRLGADRTAIPFHGDTTGDNFERLLSEAHIDRNRVFVTNAVLCNPRDANGNNATPTNSEITACSTFLRRQIAIIKPSVVATLGSRALSAVGLIEQHGLSLSHAVGKAWPWQQRILVPLYHPSARAMIHRPFHLQRSDYATLARSLGDTLVAPYKAIDLARAILSAVSKPISYFALHKLFYLIEYYTYRNTGSRLTDAYMIRQLNGPYVTDLAIKKLLKADRRITATTRGSELFLTINSHEGLLPMYDREPDDITARISPVLHRYWKSSDSQLKTASYLTLPMRTILKAERQLGRSLNRPIIFRGQ